MKILLIKCNFNSICENRILRVQISEKKLDIERKLVGKTENKNSEHYYRTHYFKKIFPKHPNLIKCKEISRISQIPLPFY